MTLASQLRPASARSRFAAHDGDNTRIAAVSPMALGRSRGRPNGQRLLAKGSLYRVATSSRISEAGAVHRLQAICDPQGSSASFTGEIGAARGFSIRLCPEASDPAGDFSHAWLTVLNEPMSGRHSLRLRSRDKKSRLFSSVLFESYLTPFWVAL